MSPGRRVAVGISAVAVLWGVLAAVRQAWLCDDAFISFRYADHLAHGLGLVYNAGERVEGYSNFLWTVWSAFGMRFGAAPESWSIAWGVFFYAATIALLALSRLERGGGLVIPVAAILAALHLDWNIYATSGLETSLFTFLVTLAYVLAVDMDLGVRGAAGAGLVCALAALTRPDGVLFAPIIGLYLAWTRRPRLASTLAFAGVFVAAFAPYVAWKLAYYGNVFPNTYYAKSAYQAWYEQGWIYFTLFREKYWILVLAFPIAAIALLARARDDATRAWSSAGALAAVLALVYTFYVIRVGGDFMYARLLIPAVPFYLILLELGVERLAGGLPLVEALSAAAAAAALVLTPYPFRGSGWVGGIVNERDFYQADAMAKTRREGLTLRRFFHGLPVKVAFVGSQAALVYYAQPAIAIESQTGLTDSTIAHQKLAHRGRVGHEKVAPTDYLIERRQVNFTLHHFAGESLHLDEAIPLVAIHFADVPGRVVRWDPDLLAEVERRGARMDNFPRLLDRYITGMDTLPEPRVRADYARFRRFYFSQVDDPARETPFRARLAPAKP